MGENTRAEAPRTMDANPANPREVWTNGAGWIPYTWCCQACHTHKAHDRCTGENTLGTKACQCDCRRAEHARAGEGS